MDNTSLDFARKILATLEHIRDFLKNAPGQNHQQSVHKQHDPETEPASAEVYPPLVPQVEPTLLHPPKTQQDGRATVSWWKSALETFALIAGIVYAIVTYLQWRDLRHNFEIDQRAWLKIEYGSPSTSAGVSAAAKIINVGKSPALHAKVGAVLEVVERHHTLSFSPRHGFTGIDFPLLFPNDINPFMVVRFSKLTPPPKSLSESELESLKRGDSYIAVFGQATYADQFGWHWMRFCMPSASTDPNIEPGHFNTKDCIAWNQIGDGDPPPE